MDIVCSLPSIDHMTGSKSTVMTSSINRQPIPVHKTTSESKGVLPPLSVLLRPTPQHNLSEIQGENSNSVNEHKQQQHLSRTASPLFPAPHNHISGQLNSPDHHPHQNNVGHSSQRDMRLPSIKHFENITNIQHSSSSIKQHQAYPPFIPQQCNLECSNNCDLLSQSSPHLAHNSTVWTRPQTISHSPKQSQSPVTNNTSSQKPPIYGQNMDSKPVRFVTNNYPPDYQNNESFIKDNVESSINTQNTDKMLSDMQKIADHCTIISQFATQYGDYRNQANKFGGGPFIPSPWISSPTGTPIVNLEQQVTEMISRTCEILNVLNCVKSEIGQTVSNDQDTINLIRTKRTTVGPSATRTKYRKRSKRAAPPGRCHSCNISETPEWRRGPDGARTLCNACGLHFAKLTRKRALSAMQQHQPTQVQVHKINQMAQMNRTTQVLPSIQPIGTQPKPTMGIMGNMGNMHLAPPLQTNQMMQSPPKRPRHDIPMNHHQMNGPINGNYLKA
ncbi:3072_t:CDS:2 [Rhizophagus irregularis]|nr:3072_t:CDS:2 [Rhizophagus irregularis]